MRSLLCLTLAALLPATGQAIDLMDRPDRVQVFLGVMEIDDEQGELQSGDGEEVEINFDSLPTIGLEVETPLNEREAALEYGINAGGGISWKGDGTSMRGTVGGQGANVVFKLDNSFLLAEFHMGGYLRAHLGEKVDVYLGAGPALIYGSHDVDDMEDVDGNTLDNQPIALEDGTVVFKKDNSSDFILGYYGRIGIEFDVGGSSQMGVGVRYLGGEMDFNDTIGKIDINGVQFLFTYSAWY